MSVVSSIKTSIEAEKKFQLLNTSGFASNYVYDSVLILVGQYTPHLKIAVVDGTNIDGSGPIQT